MIKFLIFIFKFNFGEFEERKFKKNLRFGSIFLVIVGIYWAMKPLVYTARRGNISTIC